MKITYKELVEMITARFEAPISLLEVESQSSRLINGLPLTYFLRYISKSGEGDEDVAYEVEVISEGLMKIEKGDLLFILEQDNNDNVLNFNIG